MIALIVGVAAAAILVGVALVMPCKACQRRRERLEAAYEAWRSKR